MTIRIVVVVLFLLLVWGCATREQRTRRAHVSASTSAAFDVPLGLDAFAAVPEENPVTAAKTALGRRLFEDPILSLDRTRSCASCHRPDAAFADSARVSPGIRGRRTTRNAPTLLNLGHRR
jgi:cytochrome c peroxidase